MVMCQYANVPILVVDMADVETQCVASAIEGNSAMCQFDNETMC